ncbi:nitrilase-related carbon-nitrogen hydrolase [Demetria terragena]|uniref:nitrilase-related carbon-nitrogen hydrolase n=1 Tax=Demetria terragena TaxID=63959 RepID=UPI00036CA53A|nr:nitrilase-related carbon-nitrogen hydrolase [Demetria terragena]
MTAPLTVAAWQYCPDPRDRHANLSRLTDAARVARDGGAHLLVTPELVLTGYDVARLERADLEGAVERVAEAAKTAGMALIAGVARLDQDGQTRNSAVAVDSDGTVLAIHDKAHLFGDIDLRFTPGNVPVTVVELAGRRIGLLICYEIEFPEPARIAALERIDLLAVPTANMQPYQGVHDILVPARALENGIPVVYANRVGQERSTHYLGRSLLVDGDGVIQAEGSPAGDEVLVASLAAGRSTQLQDRRTPLFSPLSQEHRR